MVKKRENSRFIGEREDGVGNILCLIPTCNEVREKYKRGKRFRNYCKNHTYMDMRVFTSWSVLRKKALKRDNWTCVKCGFKTEPYSETGQLIVDHIEPIALGGDEWDINNLQTFCVKCNKEKTKIDIAKIAEARRIEKTQAKNSQLQFPEVRKGETE